MPGAKEERRGRCVCAHAGQGGSGGAVSLARLPTPQLVAEHVGSRGAREGVAYVELSHKGVKRAHTETHTNSQPPYARRDWFVLLGVDGERWASHANEQPVAREPRAAGGPPRLLRSSLATSQPRRPARACQRRGGGTGATDKQARARAAGACAARGRQAPLAPRLRLMNKVF